MRKSIGENDWRLMGQEKYLKGEKMIYSSYKPDKTDHDHCEFCLTKFGSGQGDLHSGYCTIDRYHWICEECYEDFKELFQWK